MLIQSDAYNIYSSEKDFFPQGDLEFRIISKDKFVTVARIPFELIEKNKDYFPTFFRALKNWFKEQHNLNYEKKYRINALKGKNNPFETWKKIKKRYNLPDTFDVKSTNIHQPAQIHDE